MPKPSSPGQPKTEEVDTQPHATLLYPLVHMTPESRESRVRYWLLFSGRRLPLLRFGFGPPDPCPSTPTAPNNHGQMQSDVSGRLSCSPRPTTSAISWWPTYLAICLNRSPAPCSVDSNTASRSRVQIEILQGSPPTERLQLLQLLLRQRVRCP